MAAATTTPSTRERLLQAALELTREGGYAAASVAAIAARAGVSSGALYRHWPSKGELFAELFRSVCTRELAAMRAAGEQAGAAAPPTERIAAILGTFATRALLSPRLAWALIAEPVDPLVEAARLDHRRTYREDLEVLLRAGVDAGELPEQDVALTAAALVGALGEALVGPTAPPAHAVPPVAETVAALQRFARRAIGAAAPS